MSSNALATKAARAAARLRADLSVGPAEAICPFDIAERLTITVRFVALPSLEGMYSPEPRPTIVVSVERPAGRRRYTCGHELGHHVFGHGTRLDQLGDEGTTSWSPEEYLAQRFAAALMMPQLAVDVEVGDVVVLPPKTTFEGKCAAIVDSPARHRGLVMPGCDV